MSKAQQLIWKKKKKKKKVPDSSALAGASIRGAFLVYEKGKIKTEDIKYMWF